MRLGVHQKRRSIFLARFGQFLLVFNRQRGNRPKLLLARLFEIDPRFLLLNDTQPGQMRKRLINGQVQFLRFENKRVKIVGEREIPLQEGLTLFVKQFKGRIINF